MIARPPAAPADMDLAADTLGARCGHGALAAALGMSVSRVMRHFEQDGWINIPIMRRAIRSAGWHWRKREPKGLQDLSTASDEVAVVMIQFTGPWCQLDNPFAACRYRHWIAAACNSLVFDSNHHEWISQKEWENIILPDLLPTRGDGGWYVSQVLTIVSTA